MRDEHATAPSRPDHAAHEIGERRLFRRVLWLTLPLGMMVFLLLPNYGPIWRFYSIPAGSMAPAIPAGHRVVSSAAAYGYSRYSFDWFQLPIAGRLPAWAPTYGDIVTFRLPRDRTTPYIKRVVGLPGDRIQMVNGRLLINDKATDRRQIESLPNPDDDNNPKKTIPTYIETLPNGVSYTIIEVQGDTGMLDNTAVFTVPPGHFFMMGDNRDNSADSRMRNGGVGYVPLDHIIGRIVLVL